MFSFVDFGTDVDDVEYGDVYFEGEAWKYYFDENTGEKIYESESTELDVIMVNPDEIKNMTIEEVYKMYYKDRRVIIDE